MAQVTSSKSNLKHTAVGVSGMFLMNYSFSSACNRPICCDCHTDQQCAKIQLHGSMLSSHTYELHAYIVLLTQHDSHTDWLDQKSAAASSSLVHKVMARERLQR